MVLCAFAALAMSTTAAPRAQAATVMTDWTAVGGNTATGTLLGASVDLKVAAGYTGHVWDTPVSRTDETWTGFNGPDFSPSLTQSDEIQLSGFDASTRYTLTFGGEGIVNPTLLLGSLASSTQFTGMTATRPDGTIATTAVSVTKLSGATTFTASGSVVSGTPTGVPGPEYVWDSSGAVRLNSSDPVKSVTFTASRNYPAATEDGILLQVVARVDCADWTTPTPTSVSGKLLGSDVSLSGGPMTSAVNGNWTSFDGPDFTPSLPTSDMVEIGGATGRSYAIGFSATPRTPILLIGSLASSLGFPAALSVTKVDGPAGDFTVTGTTVTGKLKITDPGPEHVYDSSGTVRLGKLRTTGASTTSFSTTYTGPQPDGIPMQVCAQT